MNDSLMQTRSDVSQPAGTDSELYRGARSRLRVGEFGWVWFGLLVVFILSLLVAPGTLHRNAFTAILPFAAVLAIAAAGETLVIQQRGLDLSLPGTISICALAMAKTESQHGSMISAAIVTLVIAVAIGTINGLVITRLSITPLVATLAVNSLVVGGAYSYSHGSPVPTSAGLTTFARAKLAGVPAIVIVAVALVVLLAVLSNKSVFGRRFVIVGASAAAARAAGVQVMRYQMSAYIGSSICAGLAGVLLAGYTGSATSDLGTPYLLTAIAAVVVGGTPFTGGRGSLIATAAAALFLSQLGQVTLALGAPSSIQAFVQAGALIVAASLRHLHLASTFTAILGHRRPRADRRSTGNRKGTR
jgi:ribose transport system permease protein